MEDNQLLQEWMKKNSYELYKSLEYKLGSINENNFKDEVLGELDRLKIFYGLEDSNNLGLNHGIRSGQILIYLLSKFTVKQFLCSFFNYSLNDAFFSKDHDENTVNKIKQCLEISKGIESVDVVKHVAKDLAIAFFGLKFQIKDAELDFDWVFTQIDKSNSLLLLTSMKSVTIKELYDNVKIEYNVFSQFENKM